MTIASDYAGLWAWYKASSGGWTDQSGNGRDATLPGGAANPTIAAAVANGHDAFQFLAANHQHVTLPSLAALARGEMFAVVAPQWDPTLTDASSGSWTLGNGTATTGAFLPWTDSNIYEDFGSTVRKTVGDPALSLASDIRIVNIWSDAGNWGFSLDGTLLFSTSTNTVGWPATAWIGQSKNSDRWLDGRIAEWFLYSQLRSSSERTALITALQATYQGKYVPMTSIIASELIQTSSAGGTGGTGGGPGGLGDTAGGAAWMYRKG